MLDLNDIAMFVHVARCGSFAEAARQLAIPPNTVSRRIQQLEVKLGTRLMQRSTRRLTLTSAGRAFHERCAAPVDGLVEAGEELRKGSQVLKRLGARRGAGRFLRLLPDGVGS